MQFFGKIALFIASCFAAAGSVAQVKSVSGPDSYRAIHLTVRDGLVSGNGLYAMFKDSKGFLWIGSTANIGELCRFDGVAFKKYVPGVGESGEINSEYIQSFEEDSLHNIWIGTGKGVSRYDIKADTFTNFLPLINSGSSSQTIVPFWVTKDEVFCIEPGGWITTFNTHTLARKKLIQLSKKDDPGIAWNTNKSFFDARSNSIWMLKHYERTRGELEEIFLDGKIQYYSWPCYRKNVNHFRHDAEDMVYDSKRNSVWINSGEGLLEFSLNDKKFRRIEAFDKITESKTYDRGVGIDIDPNGRVWFASYPNNIFIYDPGTEQVRKPLADTSLQKLAAQYNLRLYCDRDGIVWVSNYLFNDVYELLPYSPPVKRYVPDPKLDGSLSNKNIASIVPGPKGKMWIGTLDGLNIFDPVSERFEVLREKDLPGILGKLIMPLVIDTIHQKAWLGAGQTEGGRVMGDIYEMNLETRECRPITLRDGSKQFGKIPFHWRLVKPYKNGLLICDDEPGGGLFEVKENSLYADLVIPFNKHIGITNIILNEDRFLFLRGEGIVADHNFSFENMNGKWIKIPHLLDTLKWFNIIYSKKDQSQWMSFNYELVHYDKDFHKIRSYTENDAYAASDPDAFNMLFDNAGYIWFDNYLNQICRLDTASGIITVLTEADGYEEQAYGSGSSAAKDLQGNLYFGDSGYETATKGLDRIYPERYSSAATVYLRSLDINQKPFLLSAGVNNVENLSLRYDQNNINIETGIIDYYAKGKGHIRYKLEQNGKDVNWQYGSAYYAIRYLGLQPGKYKLIIQASNVGNEFNGPEKILIINISPAFWNTWWFRTIAVIFTLGVFYLVIRFRTQQKFKLQLERTGKEKQIAELGQRTAELQQQKIETEMQALRAQMNPHFIFNSLNSINRFILQNNRAQASEYLTKFSKLVRMILQNSQASLVTLESELEALRLYLEMEALRFNFHFSYKISVPEDLDIEVLKVPPLIIQPFVENAIWHGLMHKEEKGQLDIEASQDGDHLVFRIADDGIGRRRATELASKSATKHKSMGLRITTDRIAIMQSNNGVESPVTINDLINNDGSAAGTEVIIKIPVLYD